MQVGSTSLNYNKGVKDESTRVVPTVPEQLPSVLAKIYYPAEKGNVKPNFINGSNNTVLYGAKTFSKDFEYFNHTNLFATLAMGTGAPIVGQRIVMEDAKVANARLWVEYVKKDIPNYERMPDGSVKRDANTGTPVTDSDNATVLGYEVRHVLEYYPDGIDIGTATQQEGTLIGKDGSKSVMMAIMDINAEAPGKHYNKVGISLSTLRGDSISPKYFTEAKHMPYALTVFEKPTPKSNGVIKANLYGEKSGVVSFVLGGKDPETRSDISIGDLFPKNWTNYTNKLFPAQTVDMGDTFFYYENIAKLNKMFTTVEADYLNLTKTFGDETVNTSDWYDFVSRDKNTVIEDESNIFNILTFKSSKNVEYVTIKISTEVVSKANCKQISHSIDTPFYLQGGTDGTYTNEKFEAQVVKELKKYSDINSRVQNTAVNIESMLIDTGFTLKTKEEFANAISIRKDIWILAATSEHNPAGVKTLTLSQERSRAVTLTTRYRLAAESTEFATPTVRAVVAIGDGNLANDYVKDRLPLTFDIGLKYLRYMGAYNWNSSYKFSNGSGAIVNTLKNLESDNYFIPEGIKNVLNDAAIVYAEPRNHRGDYFIPVIQTIYTNQTSILKSGLVAVAITNIQKAHDEARREFSGNQDNINKFTQDMQRYISNQLKKSRFDGLITCKVYVTITETDKAKGYAYTVRTELFAENAKTAMTSFIIAKRLEDLNE